MLPYNFLKIDIKNSSTSQIWCGVLILLWCQELQIVVILRANEWSITPADYDSILRLGGGSCYFHQSSEQAE